MSKVQMDKTLRAITSLAGLLIATATASGADDLRLAHSYELANASSEYLSLMNTAGSSDLKFSIQIQSRYQYNSRDDAGTTLASPKDDTTMGFSIRRGKFGVTGKVTESIKAKVKFGFSRSTGLGVLEDAYADWKFTDQFSLRFGQFKPSLIREENVSSSKQLFSERSTLTETIDQDFTQGLEFKYSADRWRAMFALNDDLNKGDNTAFNSPTEADYSFSVRAEMLLGDVSWGQFKQFTSFRASEAGGMIGIAGHHQSSGSTNPSFSPTTSTSVGTLDFSWVDDGWNFFAAGIWRGIDNGTTTFDDYMVVVQGGVFVTDEDEIFARWDSIFPDAANGATSQDFASIGAGWNHYVIPESHAAKFTVDAVYYLDATTQSIVTTSDGKGLLPDSEGGQLAITAQMQILF